MKPNKALRRLTKIEELMSDVVERFSTNAPSIRKALRDAVAAVAVAKRGCGFGSNFRDGDKSSGEASATEEGRSCEADSGEESVRKAMPLNRQ